MVTKNVSRLPRDAAVVTPGVPANVDTGPERVPGLPDLLTYPHRWHIYRVLFSDGYVEDVRAISDDSEVRRWMVEQRTNRIDVDKGLRIMGVVDLGVDAEYLP
jgi:hypothetical protein